MRYPSPKDSRRAISVAILAGLLSAGCLHGQVAVRARAPVMVRRQLSGARSSSLLEPGWDPAQTIDGWFKAPWFSSRQCRAGEPEWLSVELGKTEQVQRIVLWPRYSVRDRKPLSLCFPKGFVLQASQDGETWTDLPGTRMADYRTPENWSGAVFVLPGPIDARFIRLFVNECGADDYGGKFLQLAEVEVFGPGVGSASSPAPALPSTTLVHSKFTEAPRVSAAASSVIWAPRNLIDGWNDNPWFSTRAAHDGQAEWASVELASVAPVREIVLVPRFVPYQAKPASVCFPVDFELQGSLNGADWTTLPGQQYTGYPRPSSLTGDVFTLSGPVASRYVRLVATRFSADGPAGDGRGGKYLQLSEFWVFQDAGHGPSNSGGKR